MSVNKLFVVAEPLEESTDVITRIAEGVRSLFVNNDDLNRVTFQRVKAEIADNHRGLQCYSITVDGKPMFFVEIITECHEYSTHTSVEISKVQSDGEMVLHLEYNHVEGQPYQTSWSKAEMCSNISKMIGFSLGRYFKGDKEDDGVDTTD